MRDTAPTPARSGSTSKSTRDGMKILSQVLLSEMQLND